MSDGRWPASLALNKAGRMPVIIDPSPDHKTSGDGRAARRTAAEVKRVIELVERARARKDLPDPSLRRAIREGAGLSLGDVSGALGVDRSTISRWETGKRRPRLVLAKRYYDLLDRLVAADLTR